MIRPRRVRAGQPMRISAATHNAMVAAIAATQTQALGMAGRDVLQRFSAPPGAVLARNMSAQTIPQYGVLRLDEPAIALAQIMAPGSLVMTGRAPEGGAAAQAIAIACQPMPTGDIGWAIVSGVTPARVRVHDATAPSIYLRRARIDVQPPGSEHLHLRASASGGANILWRAPGSGVVWAVICLVGEAHRVGDPPRYRELMHVDLLASGGGEGNATTPASWRYDVRDAATGELLGSDLDPTAFPHHLQRPSNGPVMRAMRGIAKIVNNYGIPAQEELRLIMIDETIRAFSVPGHTH